MSQIDYRDPEWAADRLGIDKNTVYKYLQDGTLPALQLGRKWLISETRLAEWLRSETERQTASRRDAASSAEHTARRMTNYSPRAREVIRVAHSEARRYGHGFLGQGHLVLALASVPECTAAKAMTALAVNPDRLRKEFESKAPQGDAAPRRRLARSPSAKRAMQLARNAASELPGKLVRTEHILVGILRAGEGEGCEILKRVGMTFELTLEHILGLAEQSSAQ